MAEARSGIAPLVVVWAVLMALLGVTIGATFLPLGPFMPIVNVGVALTKAAIIFWFYMHLRELGGLVRLVALGAVAWLLILFSLTAADYLTRGCADPLLGMGLMETRCP